jgi:hypothetical protein
MTRLSRRLLSLGMFGAAAVVSAVAASPLLAASTYTCHGAQVSLFTDYNGNATMNGGTPPGFTTHGKAYCLVWIQTYHWNNGKGAKPGTLGLTGSLNNPVGRTGVAPRKATNVPSPGVPDAGWIVNFSTTKNPVVIDGHFACKDSSQATWAQNAKSHGRGFCAIEVVPAKR